MVDVSPRYQSSTGFMTSRAYRFSEEPPAPPRFRPPTVTRFHVSPNSPAFPSDSFFIDHRSFPHPPPFVNSPLPRPPIASEPDATMPLQRFPTGTSDSLQSASSPCQPQASSSKYPSSLSNASVSSSSSGDKKDSKTSKARRSTGRGGSGNIIKPSKLKIGTVDEAEILRQRRLHAQLNPRARIASTGRGGTGNIKNASEAVPFDPSQDPDDMYEKIIYTEHKKVKETQLPSTGRGGAGNAKGGRVRPKSFSPTSSGKKGKGKGRMDTSISSESSSNWTTSRSSVSDSFEMQLFSPPPSSMSTSFSSFPGSELIAPPSQGSVSNSSAASVNYSFDGVDSFSPLPPSAIFRSFQKAGSGDTSHTTSNSSSSMGPASTHSSEGYSPAESEKKKKWWNLGTRSKKGKEVPAMPRSSFEKTPTSQGPPSALPSPRHDIPPSPHAHGYSFETFSPDYPEIPPTPPPTPEIAPVLIHDLHQRLEQFSLSSGQSSLPAQEEEPYAPSYFIERNRNVIDNYFAGEEKVDPDLWTLREDDGEGSDQCSLESSFFEF